MILDRQWMVELKNILQFDIKTLSLRNWYKYHVVKKYQVKVPFNDVKTKAQDSCVEKTLC